MTAERAIVLAILVTILLVVVVFAARAIGAA